MVYWEMSDTNQAMNSQKNTPYLHLTGGLWSMFYVYFVEILPCYTHVYKEVLKYIYGLVQERCNSIAVALELRLSCINPSI